MKKLIILLAFVWINRNYAQTLLDCEKLFVANNLQLVSERYNLDIKNAEVIQASIWELPQLSGEINMINPNANRYFDIGSQGQKAVQIDQIFYMGNKKRYEVEFARSNRDLALIEYKDVLRNLLFNLRTSYYSLFYTDERISQYRNQMQHLDTLISRFKVQVDKKNIPEKDLFRLQALRFGLNDAYKQLNEERLGYINNLKILCGLDSTIHPVAENFGQRKSYNDALQMNMDTLKSTAMQNRPDLMAVYKNLESEQAYLKWQQSLAVPDIRLGAAYDQRGGAFQNQVGLTLSMPLPIWNQNRGEIQKAGFMVKQMTNEKLLAELKVKTEVESEYQNYLLAQSNLNIRETFNIDNFNQVYNSYLVNFRKGNVSLLEFIDFMESYSNTINQYKELELQYVLAVLRMNKSLGTDILK